MVTSLVYCLSKLCRRFPAKHKAIISLSFIFLSLNGFAQTQYYEAENAVLSGGAHVEYEHIGFSGAGYVGGFTDDYRGLAAIDFYIHAPQDDRFSLQLRFANGTNSVRTVSLFIDDQFFRQIEMASGNSWAEYLVSESAVDLTAGAHTVSIRFGDQDNGNVNIDRLSLSALSHTPEIVELENVILSGGARVENNHSGYTGSGFVGGFIDDHRHNARVEFSVNLAQSARYRLNVRYANGTPASRDLSLLLNGVDIGNVLFASTGDWSRWGITHFEMDLDAGIHTLAFQFQQDNSGNINLDHAVVEVVSVVSPTPTPTLTPTPTPTPTDPGEFDATSLQYSGGTAVETEHSGYTGNGYLGGFTDVNKGLARIDFSLLIEETHLYDIDIRYANGTPTTQTLTLGGSDIMARQVNFASTDAWSNWSSVTTRVSLPAGTTDLYLLFALTDSGNINIDAITIRYVDTTPPPPPIEGDGFEAENGFYSNGAYLSTAHSGYTGTGAVAQSTQLGSRIVLVVNAEQSGEQFVTFRYLNPSTTTQRARVMLDGLVAGTLEFAPSEDWENVSVPMHLHRGIGSISLVNNEGNSSEYLIDSVELEFSRELPSRGAGVVYQAYEAEAMNTNANIMGPSREYYTVMAEASDRMSVRLSQTGHFVEFTLTEPANGVVLRASIPDSADGNGQQKTLAVFVDDIKTMDFTLDSHYSWVYGEYPFPNDPAQAKAHRFFDEGRILFNHVLPEGTRIRFEKDSQSTATYYDLDLMEAELVEAPRTRPAGFMSIMDFGATPNDNTDDLAAIQNAVDAARASATGVWIPPGNFTISDFVHLQNVALIGAGPWYSVIHGRNYLGGFWGDGDNVTLAHFKFEGTVNYREPDAGPLANSTHPGFEGNFGKGSLIQNVWIEHAKAGLWLKNGTDGLLGLGLRIRNTFADGVNMVDGVKNTSIMHSVFRNTGDDAQAMWSYIEAPEYNTNNAYINNTVQSPALANGAAIYGGKDNSLRNLLIKDVVAFGSGIAISSHHNPHPFYGTTLVENCHIIRGGSREHNWPAELGALWIYAKLDFLDINAPVVVRDVVIEDSLYQAVLISEGGRTVGQLEMDNVKIDGTGSTAIEIFANGNALFRDITIQNAPAPLEKTSGFNITDGGGNNFDIN